MEKINSLKYKNIMTDNPQLQLIKQNVDSLKSALRKLSAIEVLEYEDKNWLSGDNKTRSEDKQSLLNYALGKIEDLEKSLKFN